MRESGFQQLCELKINQSQQLCSVDEVVKHELGYLNDNSAPKKEGRKKQVCKVKLKYRLLKKRFIYVKNFNH